MDSRCAAGTSLINGSVTAAGGFRLPQASVEFSSRCGTYRTTTDMFGDYVLPAEGQATLRAERDGLRAQVKQVTVGTDGRVDFELQRLDENPGDLSGSYSLIVTASPSCTLSPQLMQRSYDASILQIQHDLSVLLIGATLAVWGGQPGFTGSRDQSAVRFVVRDTYDDGYNFVERIDQERWLSYSGTAVGSADQARIVAPFSGKLELRAPGGGTVEKCEATDHQFELTRSGNH